MSGSRAPFWLIMSWLVGICGPVLAQTDVYWQQPVDGSWHDAASWTPGIVPQNDSPAPGNAYHARLVALGAEHQVVVDGNVTVDRITLDSDDVTLLLNGGRLTALDGIHAAQGKLLLRNGTVANTRLEGPAGAFVNFAGASDSLILENVTLATTLHASSASSFRIIDLPTDLAFDGGVIEASDTIYLRTNGHRQIHGNGTIVVRPDQSSCCSPDARISIHGDSPQLTIGDGMTIRAEQGGWFMLDDWYAHTGAVSATNHGTIEAIGPVSQVTIDNDMQFTNKGTLRVAEGGRLFINSFKPGATVGQLDIGPGSQAHLYSFYYDFTLGYGYRFDQPVTIPAGAVMSLTGWWNATGTDMTVDGGTLRVRTNLATTGNWTWLNGATISLDANVFYSRLAAFAPTSDTHIRFHSSSAYLALEGAARNLNDIPGIWRLSNARLVSGTITGLPNGNTIKAGENLTLENVQLAAPTTVADGGQLRLTKTSSIDAPLSVSGGTVDLRDQWTNAAGVSVSGGRLTLTTQPASLGAISVSGGALELFGIPAQPDSIAMTGGVLEQAFSATLAQIRALPWTPDAIHVKFSTLDLAGASLDADDDNWTWDLATSGSTISNGTLTDSLGQGWSFSWGVLRDLLLQSDVATSNQLALDGTMVVDHSKLSGNWSVRTTASVTLQGTTLDGTFSLGTEYSPAPPVNIVDGLEFNGTMSLGVRRLLFQGAQSVSGTGIATTRGIRGGKGGGFEATGDLTLGPGVTFVSQRRGSVLLAPGHTLTNLGTIVGGKDLDGYDLALPILTVQAELLEQRGRLEATTGSRIEVDVPLAANEGTLALLGGKIEFRGDLALSSASVVELQVGPGASGNGSGLLTVDGNLDLSGELVVTLAAPFTPTYGMQWSLMESAHQITGAFTQTMFPEAPTGLQWIIDQDMQTVTLRVGYAPLASDYDHDGQIAAGDLAQWQLDFGTSAGSDHNGDGIADGFDFLAWQRQMGGTAPVAAVAEPQSLPLAALAASVGLAVSFAARRRRR